MGDQKSKSEKSIETSGDNNEGRYLTPIEEETESMVSSRKTLGDCSESEAEDYAEETYKSKFITVKENDNVNIINSKTQIGPRKKSLEMTVELLKSKVLNSEKEIAALKKQLSLEKFRGYEFLLRCREKNLKANLLLKVELEDWKDIVARRIQNQIAEWQLIEQKRVNEEITRISEIYSQEIWRTLKNNIDKWHIEDVERANKMIQERCRQEMEAEGIQRIYGMIQGHMESLEKRNKKAYEAFRKQIDAWERHLKEEVVKLHEDDLKKLRHQVKVWYKEQDKDWYDAGVSKKSGRSERQTEVQRIISKEASEERLLKRLREINHEDVCRIEEYLKTKLQAHQQESTKKMNDKISELLIAFEQFKHNFSLNYEYQLGIRNDFIDRVVIDNNASYTGLEVVGDFVEKNIQKSRTTIDTSITTKDENEERRPRRQGKKKSKHVSFDKCSIIEIPILPQVPDESFTRK